MSFFIESGKYRQLWLGVWVFLFASLAVNVAFADWNSGVTLEIVPTRIAVNVVDDGVLVTVDLSEKAVAKLQGGSSGSKNSIDEFAKKVIKIRIAGNELGSVLKSKVSNVSRTVFFRFSDKPTQLDIIPDFKVIETAGKTHLITVAHQGLPVIDHGVLTSAEMLLLDWQDPWYSHFQNPALKRGHNNPVMAFLYIEPQQIKSEIIVRVKEMAGWMDLGLRDKAMIYPDEFAAVKKKVGQFLLAQNNLTADSKKLASVLERADYIQMGAADIQGYQPHQMRRQAATLIGVSIIHQIEQIPQKIQWRWRLFNNKIQQVAIRAYDPVGFFDSYVTPDYPVFEWENMLADIDFPGLDDNKQQSRPVPVGGFQQLSNIFWLIGSAVFLALILLVNKYLDPRFRKIGVSTIVIIGAVLGFLLLKSDRPVFGVQFGLNEQKAKVVLNQLLWNIYQAFEASREEVAYDQLADSVSGDLQETLYLQNRQSFLVADGAVSDVKKVEIQKLTDTSSLFENGYYFDCEWLVVGEVIHWGHQHRRENIYHAKIKLFPVDGYWKIVAVEPIAQQRVDGNKK